MCLSAFSCHIRIWSSVDVCCLVVSEPMLRPSSSLPTDGFSTSPSWQVATCWVPSVVSNSSLLFRALGILEPTAAGRWARRQPPCWHSSQTRLCQRFPHRKVETINIIQHLFDRYIHIYIYTLVVRCKA